MATGVYVHIPFCQSRCRYCDFVSTTRLADRNRYVDALLSEWTDRSVTDVRTLYLGGGTPSMLPVESIRRLVHTIAPNGGIEVTMEANPGDLNPAYLQALRQAGINRLSIGIQSFDDRMLRLIGRRHTASEAIEAVRQAQEAGFDNLSIDLIYGLPEQTLAQWEQTVRQALSLGVQHLSTYCLSYEEGTPLTTALLRGEVTEVDEEVENTMYDRMHHLATEAGFEHYEVSNYALPSYRSQHNSSYWCGIPYIGLGAAAHSYDGYHRSWNTADLDTYMRDALAHSLQPEVETLTEQDSYNEALMLSLRTAEGMPFAMLKSQDIANQYIEKGLLQRSPDGHLQATLQGQHILNRIIEDLMLC